MASRREFIRNTSAGLMGMIALPQAPPPVGGPVPKAEKLPPMHAPSEVKSEKWPALPHDKKIGFAVVGIGRLTLEEILPAFAQSRLAKCVALVSGDLAKAKRVAAQNGVDKIYDYKNFDSIADNKDVQVVYIVLPNALHKEYTLRAAQAGKHVLCEKPMSVNAADAQAMVDACGKAKVKLMVAYRQQFEPNVRIIREMIAKKTFGVTKVFQGMIAQNQDAGTEGVKQWRHKLALAGGGCLPDIGLYCLNGVRHMTGEEPSEVQAMMYSTPGDPRFKEVEETMLWQMKFPSGFVASCQAVYSTHTSKYFRFGADKAWFGMDPAFQYAGNKFALTYADGNLENHVEPQAAVVNQFAAEIDHMADCVLNNKVPSCPGEEGVQDHRIMDAIYESARTGRPVALAVHKGRDVFRNPKSLV